MDTGELIVNPRFIGSVADIEPCNTVQIFLRNPHAHQMGNGISLSSEEHSVAINNANSRHGSGAYGSPAAPGGNSFLHQGRLNMARSVIIAEDSNEL